MSATEKTGFTPYEDLTNDENEAEKQAEFWEKRLKDMEDESWEVLTILIQDLKDMKQNVSDANFAKNNLQRETWEVQATPSPGWFVLVGKKSAALCNSSEPAVLQAIADLLNSESVSCLVKVT